MSERIVQIDLDNPVEFFGAGDKYLNLIKAIFPKLKIIVRGNIIKMIGEPAQIETFEKRLELLLVYFDRFGKMNDKAVEQIMEQEDDSLTRGPVKKEDILVYGRYGKLVKAQTPNQKKMVESMAVNDMVFAIGPAGTGKTYTAVALAVRALKKLDPYLQPLYDALRDMLPTQKLLSYLEDETIEIAPLAYMRGRTLDNVFAILDEAQNASESQLKMFLTRMGKSAKFIITGDITQIDLPRHKNPGLLQAQRILKNIKGIDFIYLNEKDIIRHKLVTKIVDAYQKNETRNS